jgi:hypothetical protein
MAHGSYAGGQCRTPARYIILRKLGNAMRIALGSNPQAARGAAHQNSTGITPKMVTDNISIRQVRLYTSQVGCAAKKQRFSKA